MTLTLVLPGQIAGEVMAATKLPHESGGVLLASLVETPGGDRKLLGRKLHWVPSDSYLRRTEDEMIITSAGYVPALGVAEQMGAVALWVHTHPGGNAFPSEKDMLVDQDLAGVFRLRTGQPLYGAAIFAQRGGRLTVTGHIAAEHESRIAVERLLIVGERISLIRAQDSAGSALEPIFDRNVRAFGTAVQETLRDIRVGLVGCGGTGSCVAEQLARLGVRHFTLVDPDTLSSSNLTRVYGSTPGDVGSYKTTVLACHLRSIAAGVEVRECTAMVTLEPTARALVDCDVIFGCTDDNAGRLVLSRIASYLLVPVIDCGVLLSGTGDGELTGIDGRITVLSPGAACLVCRNRIDMARAAAELMTPGERKRREDEGYAPVLGRTEPAVVAFTTAVAAAAVAELLERLIGYGPDPRPSEILLRLHDREISTNVALPRERHYCHPLSNKLGAGNTEPFLGQTWPI